MIEQEPVFPDNFTDKSGYKWQVLSGRMLVVGDPTLFYRHIIRMEGKDVIDQKIISEDSILKLITNGKKV